MERRVDAEQVRTARHIEAQDGPLIVGRQKLPKVELGVVAGAVEGHLQHFNGLFEHFLLRQRGIGVGGLVDVETLGDGRGRPDDLLQLDDEMGNDLLGNL